MPGDTGHKIFALLTTFALLLMLAVLISRHSPYAAKLFEYLRGSSSPAEAAQSKTPLSLPELIKKVKPSVVEITTYDSSGDPEGVGSGFFVGAHQVVSNWHVVDGCYRAEIKTSDSGVYAVKGILASDKEADLVMLEVEIGANKGPALKVASSLPDEGERIAIIGNPLGLEGTVSDGIVSSIRDVPKVGRLLQVTAPVSHGSSGGPVVNMFGEVVGVARLSLKDGQNLNFAVPGDQIAALKRGPLISFAELHRQQAVSLYEQALAFANSGSCNSAIPLLKQAVAEDQDYQDAWLKLGTCEFDASAYEDALGAFKEVIRINPQSDTAFYQAGRVAAELEVWDNAASLYRRAIELNPKNEDAQFGLGLVMCATGDGEGAKRIYQNLARANSTRARELYEAYPEIIIAEQPRSRETRGTITLDIDPTTGLIAVESCPTIRTKTFAIGTEPKSYCGPEYHKSSEINPYAGRPRALARPTPQ